MKTCTVCGKTKEDSQFYNQRRVCKECYALRVKKVYDDKKVIIENVVSGENLNKKSFDKTEITEIFQSLGKEYDSNIEKLITQFESDIEKIADNINNTIDILQKNIAVLEDKNKIQNDTIADLFKKIEVLRATDENHHSVISKLMEENEKHKKHIGDLIIEIDGLKNGVVKDSSMYLEKQEVSDKNSKFNNLPVDSEGKIILGESENKELAKHIMQIFMKKYTVGKMKEIAKYYEINMANIPDYQYRDKLTEKINSKFTIR
jgi:hypothetical protein